MRCSETLTEEAESTSLGTSLQKSVPSHWLMKADCVALFLTPHSVTSSSLIVGIFPSWKLTNTNNPSFYRGAGYTLLMVVKHACTMSTPLIPEEEPNRTELEKNPETLQGSPS